MMKLNAKKLGRLRYNFLVVVTGTTTNFYEMNSVKENSLGMKDIRDSVNIRHMMLKIWNRLSLPAMRKHGMPFMISHTDD